MLTWRRMLSRKSYLLQQDVVVNPRSLAVHSSPQLLSEGDDRVKDRHTKEDVKELLENATARQNERVEEDWWMRSAYEHEDRRLQHSKAFRPKVDPSGTTIILFPGQGVQYVGMGKCLLHIPSARELFNRANSVLGYNLLELCLKGPKEKLDMTVHSQPAIFVASLAALELMMEERRGSVESCVATAGFSVGEYASLVLAGSLTFETALKLLKLRAECMQQLSEENPSGMMTLYMEPAASVGNVIKQALDWCSQKGIDNPVCSVANYLFPHCKVIAGSNEALDFIASNARNLKIRKAKRIPVSGAFHTDLMKPAAVELAEALKQCAIKDPEIPVYSNIDGSAYINAADVKRKLPQQVFRPVKWEQVMHTMYGRPKGTAFPKTFECGPGESLKTMLRFQNATAAKDSRSIKA